MQKGVDNEADSSYNISCDYGMWHSLVARIVRDDEAAGSNPVIPTIECSSRQLWLAAFSFTSHMGKFVGLGIGLHLIWEEVSFFGFGAQLNGLLAFFLGQR